MWDAATLLAKLLESAEFIYLTRLDDGETASYRISVRDAQRSRAAEGDTLVEALLALDERRKRCSRCRQMKPLPQFQERKDGQSGDGRVSHCKACNRSRLSKFYPRSARKRHRANAVAEPPPLAPSAALQNQPES